jgi:glycosyltransferase involved in cell wall biosynthesis
MSTSVSVVVPTLNEASNIRALIESVRRQSYPISKLVIADGGSTDGTREIVASNPTVLLVDNPDRHAAAGRNVALNVCSTDWVLFTDGDCRPATNWAQTMMAAATRSPRVVGVGGRLIAEPQTVYEKVCAESFLRDVVRHDDNSRPITSRPDGALVTANCAYRRDVLEQVGGFDNRFSNFGEDVDLMMRVLDLDAGILVYTAEAVVVGDMPADLSATVKKWRQYGLATSHLNKFHYRRRRIDIDLYRRMMASMWAAATTSGQSRSEAFVGAALHAAHIAGKVEGSLRLRTVNL